MCAGEQMSPVAITWGRWGLFGVCPCSHKILQYKQSHYEGITLFLLGCGCRGCSSQLCPLQWYSIFSSHWGLHVTAGTFQIWWESGCIIQKLSSECWCLGNVPVRPSRRHRGSDTHSTWAGSKVFSGVSHPQCQHEIWGSMCINRVLTGLHSCKAAIPFCGIAQYWQVINGSDVAWAGRQNYVFSERI